MMNELRLLLSEWPALFPPALVSTHDNDYSDAERHDDTPITAVTRRKSECDSEELHRNTRRDQSR